MISVAIVEDHPVFRQGLEQLIGAATDVTLRDTAASVEDFDASPGSAPDVVLLDLHLPGLSGAEAVAFVRASGAAVLVISAAGTRDDVVGAVAAGADGYLTKDAEASEILGAIRVVADGGTFVSPTLAAHLLDAASDRGPGRLDLTVRDREVLALVASGERDQDIADALFISVRTVRSHLDHIRDKTGRRRRSDLTRLAVERGIVGNDHG